MLLGADRNFAELADNRRIALVQRMDRNRAVAQHGLGPRRGDGDVVASLAQRNFAVLVLFDIFVGLAARQRVFEMPHMAGRLEVLDLKVRNRRFEMRVPVDQPLAAIDQALVIHLHKDLDDGVVEIALVARRRIRRAGHGESFAAIVAGGAEAAQLLDDGAAGLCFPFPDFFEEFFAPQLRAFGLLGFHQLAFDHHLRGDPCVIRAGLPERVIALHPLPAGQDVLQRVVEGVADMQNARHVWGRDHDAEGLSTRGVCACLETACGLPCGRKPGLGLVCVECFFHGHDHLSSCVEADIAGQGGKEKCQG